MSRQSKYWSSNYEWQSLLEPDAPRVPSASWGWQLVFENYGSSVSNVLLHKLTDLDCLKQKELWLVRDGLIYLIDFFSINPDPPKAFKSTLLISKDWIEYIPLTWKKHCKQYYYVQTKVKDQIEPVIPLSKRKEWVAIINLNEHYCSIENLENKLTELKKNRSLSEARKNGLLTVYFYFTESDPVYMAKFMQKMSRFFKKDFRVVSLYELKHIYSLEDKIILNLNEKLVCSDETNLHILLGRGAMLPGIAKKNDEDDIFYPISSFHGIGIKSLPNELKCKWECEEFQQLKLYLENVILSVKPFSLDAGPRIPQWISRYAFIFAKNQDTYLH